MVMKEDVGEEGELYMLIRGLAGGSAIKSLAGLASMLRLGEAAY